jgi:hypothetical protein
MLVAIMSVVLFSWVVHLYSSFTVTGVITSHISKCRPFCHNRSMHAQETISAKNNGYAAPAPAKG